MITRRFVDVPAGTIHCVIAGTGRPVSWTADYAPAQDRANALLGSVLFSSERPRDCNR